MSALPERAPLPVPGRLTGPAMPAEIGNKLVDISIELIDKLYVHLPLKRSMDAVSPMQRLRLAERQSYSEMLSIFCARSGSNSRAKD